MLPLGRQVTGVCSSEWLQQLKQVQKGFESLFPALLPSVSDWCVFFRLWAPSSTWRWSGTRQARRLQRWVRGWRSVHISLTQTLQKALKRVCVCVLFFSQLWMKYFSTKDTISAVIPVSLTLVVFLSLIFFALMNKTTDMFGDFLAHSELKCVAQWALCKDVFLSSWRGKQGGMWLRSWMKPPSHRLKICVWQIVTSIGSEPILSNIRGA